ncbi:MAG TPA: hypothetical protein DEA26_08345 [Oceanospirillales bacterium]|nr:hypothetical protein [Oceanospirillaceae bacterium]HBS42677.1 hypothetical protein [Oceanospirillales bacterium]|tara:strand:+ start:62 stop:373 length:312 start_codon:yes stop_codon:yes gene_type:complete
MDIRNGDPYLTRQWGDSKLNWATVILRKDQEWLLIGESASSSSPWKTEVFRTTEDDTPQPLTSTVAADNLHVEDADTHGDTLLTAGYRYAQTSISTGYFARVL